MCPRHPQRQGLMSWTKRGNKNDIFLAGLPSLCIESAHALGLPQRGRAGISCGAVATARPRGFSGGPEGRLGPRATDVRRAPAGHTFVARPPDHLVCVCTEENGVLSCKAHALLTVFIS